ncbi:MAG: PorP/SprF family type IX secretion system membrane protein [Bacteroidetes bacterium]|nr:PorP/SprF family type IX secretion system membrane protein [Bacteroidota bacterium]
MKILSKILQFKNLLCYLSFIPLLWGWRGAAQDIQFSQFQRAPHFTNPAMIITMEKEMTGYLNYKSQWKPAGGFSTMSASFASPIPFSLKYQVFGVGVSVINDAAGDIPLRNTRLLAVIADVVKLAPRHFCTAAIQGGVLQRHYKFENITWVNQYNGTEYDPSIPSGENQFGKTHYLPDFSAGLIYEFISRGTSMSGERLIRLNGGIACHHINRPNQSVFVSQSDPLALRWVATANGWIDLPANDYSILPVALFTLQGPSKQVHAGAIFRYAFERKKKFSGFTREKAFAFGINYKYREALVTQFYYDYEQYSFGLSYDITMSEIGRATGLRGGMEFSFRYRK